MPNFTAVNIRTWARLGSCGALGIAAEELAEVDDKFVFVTADLCFYSGLTRFSQRYPERFYNVGIAEQNMVGIAAGLASEGFNTFASTYATFVSTRSLDQVRVNLGYMRLPIKLVGLTAGLSTGILGPTHISCEDIAVMRTLPNVTVISPADTTATIKAVIEAGKINSPVYLRLGGAMGSPVVYKEDFNFKVGKAITLLEGRDVAIIATGPMVYQAMQAAKMLEEENILCTVVDMHTIKPLDTEAIDKLCGHKLIVTVEEHSIVGGLGGAIAEHLARKKEHPHQFLIGIEDFYPHAGDYQYLLEQCGLTAIQIKDRILKEYCK